MVVAALTQAAWPVTVNSIVVPDDGLALVSGVTESAGTAPVEEVPLGSGSVDAVGDPSLPEGSELGVELAVGVGRALAVGLAEGPGST